MFSIFRQLWRQEPEANKAELRTGGWNYYDDYFDKIEEFRSDFA